MKRSFLLLSLLCLALFCTACGNTEGPIPEEGLRVYTQRDLNGEPFLPGFILEEEEQRFSLVYPAESSYTGAGTYTVFSSNDLQASPKESGDSAGNYTDEGHYLLLKTDDGEHQFIFEKAGDHFIFRAEGSTPIPFADVEDGAVFR